MFTIKQLFLCAATAIGLFAGGSAFGAVSLLFTDNDANPTITSAVPGGTFQVLVKLLSTSVAAVDSVNGITYAMQSTGPQMGVFTLAGRDNTGSAFIDYNNSTAISNPSDATLNPSNTFDLGATTNAGVTVKNNSNPYNPAFVAMYTIAVAANAAPGNYTLSFANPSGGGTLGYSDANFTDRSFSAPNSGNLLSTFTVSIPEPSSVLLLGGGLAALFVRGRRKVA